MKHKKSKRKFMTKRTSKMSPGEQRRSTILARIGYFKESLIIKAVHSLMAAITAYRKEENEKAKIFFTKLISEYISYLMWSLIPSGLYMLYFEVAKFGWPKEKSWIKFRRVLKYIFLTFAIIGFLAENGAFGSIINSIAKEQQGKINMMTENFVLNQ